MGVDKTLKLKPETQTVKSLHLLYLPICKVLKVREIKIWFSDDFEYDFTENSWVCISNFIRSCFHGKIVKSIFYSVEIVVFLSYFFDKNFVKASFLLKSWIHEFFFGERKFHVFPQCVLATFLELHSTEKFVKSSSVFAIKVHSFT